ncbi:hypothetical protein ACXJJ3_08620 [Kribbella sp. WER1]|uniref:hypothetical protein n=1 Tax=Kribbella sp. NPDC059898 TaxID=3346995 RepID=UPI00364EC885
MTLRATRDLALRTAEALSEEEIVEYAERCPPEHRWAFEAFLRGTRDLAGDEITGPVDPVVPSGS